MPITDKDEEMILRYIDGELEADERALVQERLEQDEEFRAAYEEYLSLERAFRKVRSTAPSLTEDDFVARVNERIDAAQLRESPPSLMERIFGGWRGFVWGLAIGAAAGALAFALVMPRPSIRMESMSPRPVVVATTKRTEAVEPRPVSAQPLPSEAVRPAAAEPVKAYEILSISSEYVFSTYPVVDGDGYELLVVFVSYQPEAEQAI